MKATHNSAPRHASFSSNHSGGLLPGSQQRLNEKQIAPDMQQIISRAIQATKSGEPMQFQLGDQQMSNLTQSAQRAHELELASKLVKDLQNLYTMSDQELDQAV